MSGRPKIDFTHLISAISAKRLLNRGCQGYLADVWDVEFGVLELGGISVVEDFSDVFPKDLLGLPPERDIEFCIDVPPRTQPITIFPLSCGFEKIEGTKGTTARSSR